MDRIRDEFPDVKFGVTNCRPIAGTSTWSQHSWSNAIDIFFSEYGDTSPTHQAQIDEVAVWLREHEAELDIRVFLWKTKNHYDHIHLDFWPKGYGTPPCKNGLPARWKYPSGLVTGVYYLVTEDEVPQFTEEEAEQLKLFLQLIEERESNVHFVKHAIDLIRKERQTPLHDHQGEVLVDKGARDQIADLLEKLRSV